MSHINSTNLFYFKFKKIENKKTYDYIYFL